MKTLTTLQRCWAVVLAGALTWGSFAGHGTWPALTGRMASSLVLVAAAAVAWRRSGVRLAVWTLAGMAFGALGDFFNAGLLPGGTIAGIGAFGIGHVCYISGMLGVLITRRARDPVAAAAVAGWLLTGVLGWYVVVWLAPPLAWDSPPDGLAALVWPALGYTLLLSATAGFGTALALADRAYRRLALGAALFLLSDLILAVALFRGPFPQDTLAVWIPYGVGQMLIVFTVARQVVPQQQEPS
ncbi:MAG: lysoplasmalogenase [Pseudomonadales bacterium]